MMPARPEGGLAILRHLLLLQLGSVWWEVWLNFYHFQTDAASGEFGGSARPQPLLKASFLQSPD